MIDPTELRNRIARQSQIILSNFIVASEHNPNIQKAENTILSKKMKKVMEEFSAGTLKTPSGEVVTDKKQALAIAYSEAEDKEKESK